MPSKRGLFITFEGGEGAGKTTLITSVESSLLQQGRQVLRTREPGGTKLGEQIRGLLLNHENGSPICSQAELFLFLSVRAQHLEESIRPALAQGKIVLCDRFNDSTIAYQGHARKLGMDVVAHLCDIVCGETVPDLTLFLDVDPQEGLKRARRTHKEHAPTGELDRIESEALEFHRSVWRGLQQLAEKDPERIFKLDASQSAEQVFRKAWSKIASILPK